MRLTRVLLSNYFKRYIERELQADHLRRQWHPLTGWKIIKKEEWHYNEHRPWTAEFKQENGPFQRHKPVFVQPIKEWKIFKGDRVEILVGKDKGKQGIIHCIIKERNWCFVDGLNCEYKMVSTSPSTQPVCSREEKPLLVTTQVSLVDPSDDEPTEIEWRFTEEGDRVRVSTRTGRVIPLSIEASTTEDADMIVPSIYKAGPKDTTPSNVEKVTFVPKLISFEAELMQAAGIKEDRVPAKTYWY